MIAAWMLYAMLVGCMVALASLLAERAARALGRATRFIWLGALGAALALSAGRLMVATGSTSSRASAGARQAAGVTRPAGTEEAIPASPGSFTPSRFAFDSVTVPDWLFGLDGPLLVLWLTASATWALALVASAARLRRRSRTWRRTSVDGVGVHVSEDVGPALFGLTRYDIVIPSWALQLDPTRQRMILAHEQEHARAADPISLLAGALFVLLQPWNPIAWLMYHRLRFAVEADCDARVLAHTTDLRAYGELLLDVGTRGSSGLAPVAALSEGHSNLERRITLMTQPSVARPQLRSSVALVAAAALAFVACQLPRPVAGSTRAHSELAPQLQLRAYADPASALFPRADTGRTIVRLTSLGLEDVGSSFTILVFADGPARVGIGREAPTALTDTLRLSSLPAMTMDVTEGDVHLRLVGPGRISIRATVSNGAALTFSANGPEVIVLKGGRGVRIAKPKTRTP